MGKSTQKVLDCKLALVKPMKANEYGDVRSILDELLPSPLWSEQVEMAHHLTIHVNGAMFAYYPSTGWFYTEAGT